MAEESLPALPGQPPAHDLLKSLRHDLSPSLKIMLDVQLYEQVKRLAGIMAKDSIFTPRHLVGKPEACFTVITQALNWNIDPQFVARCTYQTPGGSIGFEGKLVQAILEQSGKFIGAPAVEYIGDWSRVIGKFTKATSQKGNEFVKPAWTDKDAAGLGVIVRWQVKGEETPRVWPGENEPFYLTQCYPLNSPLWATDARTQIRYLAMRRFADGAAPGILGGMAFAFDDMAEASAILKDVTPEPPPRPTREQFREQPTVVDVAEPFEVVDMTGTVAAHQTIEAAVDAYYDALDEGERQRGEAGLTAVWDNNQGFMRALDERGQPELTKAMGREYGERRSAAANRTAAREQMKTTAGSAGIEEKTELRGSAAERPDASTASHPDQRQGEPSVGPLGLGIPEESKPPRSGLWAEASYELMPPRSRAGGDVIDWPSYAQALLYYIEADDPSLDEIAKLRADNKAHLNRMRMDASDDYRALVVEIERRVEALKKTAT